MQQTDAINLIRTPLLASKSQIWADLGCGSGTFTLALASLLAPNSHIYALDTDAQSLSTLRRQASEVALTTQVKDFVNDTLDLPPLDGVLMANSIHYVKDKTAFLKRLSAYLKPQHYFLMVEYDTTQANPWVPYPIPFTQLRQLFITLGYHSVQKLGEQPSIYNRNHLYSALVLP